MKLKSLSTIRRNSWLIGGRSWGWLKVTSLKMISKSFL